MGIRFAILATAMSALTFVRPVDGQDASVLVGDFFFCDASTSPEECVTIVSTGDTVVWIYSEGTAGHTVTACGESCDSPIDTPSFDSGRILAPDVFSATFRDPGTYPYYCEFHPQAMRGTVIVEAATTPTRTERPTSRFTSSPTPQPREIERTPASSLASAVPTSTPAVSQTDEVSDKAEDGDFPFLLLIPVGIVAAIALAALAAIRQRRG